MLRYRIRDSVGAPSRARKQTQCNPVAAVAAAAAAVAASPVLSALAASVLFFLPPSSIECRPPTRLGGELQAVVSEGKDGMQLRAVRTIFLPGSKFRDYRQERSETAYLLYSTVCSLETNRRVFISNAMTQMVQSSLQIFAT